MIWLLHRWPTETWAVIVGGVIAAAALALIVRGASTTPAHEYEDVMVRDGGPYIRILHLQPSKDKSAPIEAKLQVESLSTVPKYEALSYVWGKKMRKCAIKLIDSGAVIDATENLAVALIHLRSPDRVRTLWIDAICINQQNLAEKSQQVALMGSIFSKAVRVVIWLGPATDYSDVALKILRKLYKNKKRYRSKRRSLILTP